MFVFSVIHLHALHLDNLLDERQEIITTFGLILMQVLYLVGILLMTFDLLTCGHSKEGNDHPSVQVNIVPISSSNWSKGTNNFISYNNRLGK